MPLNPLLTHNTKSALFLIKKKSRFITIVKYTGISFLILGGLFIILSLILSTFFSCGCFFRSPHYGESTSINTLSAGVKNVYAGSKTFDNLSNAVLINTKAAPDKMTIGPATLQNGYDGLVVVEPATLSENGITTPHNAYKITYPNVPSIDCEQMATGVGRNFVQLIINGQIVKKYPSKEDVEIEAAQKACKEDKNTIFFYGN